MRAGHAATREEIAGCNAEWEIIGPYEIRDVDLHARYFTPLRVTPHSELMRMFQQPAQLNLIWNGPPAIDSIERFLTMLFLRRYVTYCARRKRYAHMQGAAQLLGEIRQL